MRLGALLGPVRDPHNARELADAARRLEGEGYASLWSAQAVARGFMVTDPFVALATAAAVTDKVELGTAVVQVPLYQPVDFAHRVISLQQVCGNRLLLGVGAGSTEQDFLAYDQNYAARFKSFRTAMRAIRTALATGRSNDIDLSPWPTALGSADVLLGSWGNGVTTAAREYDGWIASGMYREPPTVIAALEGYRAALGERSGRAIVSTIPVGRDTDLGLLGDTLGKFAEAGFDDAVVLLQPGGPDAAAVRKLVPA